MAPTPIGPQGTKPIDKQDWFSKLGDWAYQLTVLKVVTYVGDAAIEMDQDGKVTGLDLGKAGKPFVTICDLIGGDITNVVPDAHKDDTALVDFHSKQVEKAAAVLPTNLKALGDLVDKIL